MGILCVGRHTSACGRTVLFLSNQDRIHIVEMCLCRSVWVLMCDAHMCEGICLFVRDRHSESHCSG